MQGLVKASVLVVDGALEWSLLLESPSLLALGRSIKDAVEEEKTIPEEME